MVTIEWKPAVELDLETAGVNAFAELRQTFELWAAKHPPYKPLTLSTGWYTVTPQMAEDFLRRNAVNRKVSLQTVKKYLYAMKNDGWRRTGQPLIFDCEGKGIDLQHRCWASYLGKVSFGSLIVADAPVEKDIFAYLDDSKPRTAGDALYSSGLNGLSTMVAQAIKLSWRYDNEALRIIKQPKIRDLSIPETLEYARAHPELVDAAHLAIGTYGKALSVIDNKGIGVFVAWKIFGQYGGEVLDDFFVPLGSGANLDEDSPILALRNRLLRDEEEENAIEVPRRLALVIKAFKLFMAGKKVSGRGGLSVRDNEKFPRFEDMQPELQAAE